MRRLGSRVADLEAGQTVPFGKVHRLIQHIGQTQDEAMDVYGRHLIADNDIVVINRIVRPEWDADGNMIPQGSSA